MAKKISGKKWVLIALSVIVAVFLCSAALVIVIDPYLHYRIPDNGFNYALTTQNQRYQNDGIIRHFDYDAVITGTSMTENFKSSEVDRLFGVTSIKVPFSGGSYKEVGDTCRRALEVHPDLKMIIRSLDLSMLVKEKDSSQYSNNLEYLYNDKLMDDVNYWLNKMTLLEGCMQNVIFHTMVSEPEPPFLESFSFDEYSNWQAGHTFGAESVLAGYIRPEKSLNSVRLTDGESEMIRGNIAQNVTELAYEYPDTKFVLFITPYSICYWDSLDRAGKLEWEIEAQKIAIEELLECDNIELYSFCDNFDLVCDLDNYKDEAHYGENVNSQMLVWMREGQYKLTWDNYEDYLEEIYEFYSEYDYENLL